MLIKINVKIGYYNRCDSNIVFAKQKESERERGIIFTLKRNKNVRFNHRYGCGAYMWHSRGEYGCGMGIKMHFGDNYIMSVEFIFPYSNLFSEKSE